MEKPIETILYKGKEIEIFYDTDAQSPNEWGNDDVFLVYDHRDFTVQREGFDPTDIFESTKETKKMFFKGYFVFAVYAYIHSGVSLSLGNTSYPFNDRWDVSLKGFALVKREKGSCWTRTKAEEMATALVSEWNMYLSGEVYGYDSPAGGCWGFYGEEGKEQMIEDAKSEIDYLEKEQTKS